MFSCTTGSFSWSKHPEGKGWVVLRTMPSGNNILNLLYEFDGNFSPQGDWLREHRTTQDIFIIEHAQDISTIRPQSHQQPHQQPHQPHQPHFSKISQMYCVRTGLSTQNPSTLGNIFRISYEPGCFYPCILTTGSRGWVCLSYIGK